jgi:hypothetical protein
MKLLQCLLASSVIVGAALAFTGCSSDPTRPKSDTTAVPAAKHIVDDHKVVDPLTEITNPSSSVFIAKGITPLLHVHARGSREFTIARPQNASAAIQFFVACSPNAHFTVTMGTFYSAPCAARFLNSGAIPVSESPGIAPLQVKITISAKVDYWLVGIPTERVSP